MFVRGQVADFGNGAKFDELDERDAAELTEMLGRYEVAGIPEAAEFRKIVSDKRLYNFNKRDFRIWRTAL